MTSDERVRIGAIGAAVSANKGAASMFFGLLDGLGDRSVHAEVVLFTTYPDQDRAALAGVDVPSGIDVTISSAGPVALLLAFLVALPIRLLERLRVPTGLLSVNALVRSMRSCDVVVDLAGISFADGRGVALLGYNSVMSLMPFLAGSPVVKGSQALGPMRTLPVRWAARIVLPHMESICARGAVTRSHLDGLGLDNVVDAADVAFLMRARTSDGIADVWSERDSAGPRILLLPSSVVDTYASAHDIDHVGELASVLEQLAGIGCDVVVAPHSFRSNGHRGRMNDGPIVEDLSLRTNAASVRFLNRDVGPRELRVLASSADLVVTGRFHGMVSALEVGTIPVVIGWSHKYGEVLDQFDVPNQGIAVRDLSSSTLMELITRSLDEREDLEARIEGAHDRVVMSAGRNIDLVLDAVGSRSR